ncbi:MAG: hypothetical protein JNK56_10735, partial [Myxococcales bacterium]|nr:hypothetical protein [Myxococcales bacterium]
LLTRPDGAILSLREHDTPGGQLPADPLPHDPAALAAWLQTRRAALATR